MLAIFKHIMWILKKKPDPDPGLEPHAVLDQDPGLESHADPEPGKKCRSMRIHKTGCASVL